MTSREMLIKTGITKEELAEIQAVDGRISMGYLMDRMFDNIILKIRLPYKQDAEKYIIISLMEEEEHDYCMPNWKNRFR